MFGRGGDPPNGEISLVLDVERSVAMYDALLDVGAPHGVVAVRDDDVPLPRTLVEPRPGSAAPAGAASVEVRADGLWAEVVREADDHWSLRLEAFGLRFASVGEARASDVGERVPVGYDLEWDRGRVVGELLVGRARVAVDTTGTFTHSS